MPKTLKIGDVNRLQKLFCKISSLTGSLKILNCDTPVMVELIDLMGNREKFYITDTKSKSEIEVCVQRLLKEEKDAIRKKYDIDIK